MARAAVLAVLLLVGLVQPLQAASHPAAGQLTCDAAALYAAVGPSLPANYSMGELSFGSSRTPLDELCAAERYMLAGTQASNLPDGRPLAPWIRDVEQFCLEYAASYAELPAEISPQALALLGDADDEVARSARGALLTNPFNGRAPRLDCAAFSAGDLYVRPLSRAELLHYSALDPALRRAWFGRPEVDSAAELCGPVLYVRAYGSHGVLYENFAWQSREVAAEIGGIIALLEPQRRYSSTVQNEPQQGEVNVAAEVEPVPPPKPCRSGG